MRYFVYNLKAPIDYLCSNLVANNRIIEFQNTVLLYMFPFVASACIRELCDIDFRNIYKRCVKKISLELGRAQNPQNKNKNREKQKKIHKKNK